MEDSQVTNHFIQTPAPALAPAPGPQTSEKPRYFQGGYIYTDFKLISIRSTPKSSREFISRAVEQRVIKWRTCQF